MIDTMNTKFHDLFSKRVPQVVHRLTFTLHFDQGLAAGDGSFGNEMNLARNGNGQLVLRGTSIAGVLRNAWRKAYPQNDDTRWFGSAAGEEGIPSQLIVADTIIDIGSIRRTHHLRNRHTGAVLDNGLYSIEYAPPKSKAPITLWLKETEENKGNGEAFIKELAGLLKRGLIFGGNSNRGVGLSWAGEFQYDVYDLSNRDKYATYLDDHYAWRKEGTIPRQTSSFETGQLSQDKDLIVRFTLVIPRGQDLLVAQDNSEDTDATPHRVHGADGKDYWLIPGSTLLGLFRSWVTRLAARENPDNANFVADSAVRYSKDGPPKGDELGWLFNKKLDWKEIDKKYPVDSLFGSLHKAGRVHFTDSLCPVSKDEKELQRRMHVAIDAISGGAIEHLLFDNYVLTQGEFPVTMLIDDPREEEARWIAQTLRALDLGLLRVGSSKAAGRLELAATPQASGPQANFFDSIQPSRKRK